jgi:hypothetical protein
LIQQARAGVTGHILAHMNGVEITEEWIFGSLRRTEEKDLRDPDDVYFEVRDREAERIRQGLSPRIQFLDEQRETKAPSKSASPKNSG